MIPMSDAREKPIIFSGLMVRAILEGRKTHRRLYARKNQDRKAPDHLAARLANGLDAAHEGECWVWTRTKNNHGYGTLRVNGRHMYCHRLAYELGKGPITSGLHVLHSCDNPACINPAHLELGTQSKNMTDCHARGRSRIPSPRKKGESNGAAKLTGKDVQKIKATLAKGMSQRLIASQFGVSQSLISKIKVGALWHE